MLRLPHRQPAFAHKTGYNRVDTVRGEKRIFSVLLLALILIVVRLAYWQIWRHEDLQSQADAQYRRTITSEGTRGTLWTADGYPLVINEQRYRLYAQPYRLKHDAAAVSAQLCLLVTELNSNCDEIQTKLSDADSKWKYLLDDLTESQKASISALNEPGLGFEPFEIRTYPQASMAAQLVGFVGKNDAGENTGYFGIEGALENELRGRKDTKTVFTDALGYQLSPQDVRHNRLRGRDIVLTIRRDVQELAETQLKYGMEKYKAKSGEVIILDPANGDILALANSPSFDPRQFGSSPPEAFINRSLNDVYEPGSTFKVLTVAAGLNEGVITADTQCTTCSVPRKIAGYTIKTWNDVYQPNITMTEALEKSDNTAMIFVAERLGAEKLRGYQQKFGIVLPIGIELQGDRSTPFPSHWGPVELATISFGQGISTTTLQMVRAVAAIARGGQLINPRIIKATREQLQEQSTPIVTGEQVISAETAQTTTTMMIAAAQHGEAQWAYSKKFRAAGKTGTSQIAENGSYDPDKTIASFIGFSPPDHPKFVMMVKLVEPQSSIWAAETAAPLWFKIADQLYLLLNLPYENETAQQTQH